MILASTYKSIADLINYAQGRGSDMAYYVNRMNTNLSNSDIEEESADREKLEDQISATLQVLSETHGTYETQMLTFVEILQKYIDDNYSSVNDFLSDNSTKVLSVFADISEEVGYPIDAENIELANVS